jgi:ketosteroid isomerase-like protein
VMNDGHDQTREVSDWLAISRLMAAYAHALDAENYEAVVAMFTEDAVVDAAIGGVSRGRDALLSHYAAPRTEPGLSAFTGGRHFTSNLIVDVDGNKATAASDFICIVPDDPHPRIVFLGRYLDELERIDGEWRFSRRQTLQSLRPSDQD